ncbi:hypothetical protein WJX72_004955 [[Myrmecia] bisecta]|uniref:Enoyl-CoA hydratase n=1 Tax=[Myrmecia] bisecta TaxID=41462 RepID=A0AAW1PTK9_9CHLO
MVAALQNCVRQLQHDVASGTCRGVLLRSAVAGTFCAGADLKERASQSQQDVLQFSEDVRGIISDLARLPCPVIASINGIALGGGLELALAADIRVVSPLCTLGLPETGLGIIPGVGGTQRTPRLIGNSRAKLLMFTGRRLNGQEAVDWGLADVLSDNPDATAQQLLAETLPKAPQALAQAKVAVDEGSQMSLPSGLAFERAAYMQLFHTEDRVEALAAFAEKRPPVFKGC